jgi:FkbM family methyltransferase
MVLVQRILEFILSKLSNKVDVVALAQNSLIRNFSSISAEKISKIMNGERILILDIGARGGIGSEFIKYKKNISSVMLEANKNELWNLELKKGVRSQVINKLLCQSNGSANLYITRNKSRSSMLIPNIPNLKFVGVPMSKFDIIDTVSVDTTTIDEIESGLRQKIDYCKIDTQGSEMSILKGMTKARPLFIKCEVSYFHEYEENSTVWDIGKFLYKIGYTAIGMRYGSSLVYYSNSDFDEKNNNRILRQGDIFFIPDWSRKIGRDIIKNRENSFQAILMIHSWAALSYKILDHIKDK